MSTTRKPAPPCEEGDALGGGGSRGVGKCEPLRCPRDGTPGRGYRSRPGQDQTRAAAGLHHGAVDAGRTHSPIVLQSRGLTKGAGRVAGRRLTPGRIEGSLRPPKQGHATFVPVTERR